jgi:hypothetical protein
MAHFDEQEAHQQQISLLTPEYPRTGFQPKTYRGSRSNGAKNNDPLGQGEDLIHVRRDCW